MKVSYNWLKDYLGSEIPSAEEVANLLTAHAFEIDGIETHDDDTVIDVDVLPNRSSDSLCHRGVARELATILNVSLAHDPLMQPVELQEIDSISIDIESVETCPRFMASLMTGVEVKESPDWLKRRLELLGVRSVNNIVDATNYVMYAIGEPLHAYDADLFPQVDGTWKFVIRNAKEGEEVSLLPEGGKEEDRVVVCKGTELLIVDGSSNTPIGLAGVKGGRFSGVHAGTKNIIIEAAHFNPTTTRKTARGLGIVIDASKRFENEPSRELPPYAQREVVNLIKDIAGGEYQGSVDEYLEKKENSKVGVSTEKTNSLLGLNLSVQDIADILTRTGSTVTVEGNDCVAVGPWERTDLNIQADFIEEVARIHGLNNIASIPPEVSVVGEVSTRQYYTDKIRSILLNLGFSEVVTSSFHKKGKIQLQNALASDKSYVRGALKKNIEMVLDKNFTNCDLLGIPAVQVFEIGTVFTPTENGITEHTSLAIGVRTKGSGYSAADDKALHTAIETLKQQLVVNIDFEVEKGVAETNITKLLPELPQPTSYEQYEKSNPVMFKSPSAYPAISRDIALWVNADESADSVIEKLVTAAGSLLVRHTLFDTFEKDGRISYAFRLVFQSDNRTLTDSEVNKQMEEINKVAAENSWEVR